MWLVSLNRKKKGHDNHAPKLNEKVRFAHAGYIRHINVYVLADSSTRRQNQTMPSVPTAASCRYVRTV
ncbi:hypothetical protein CI702_03235 [Escherichia coli]|nr:hypothetical protein CI702_03235 [Escherichia coli]UMT09807.1 hypothetical protein AOY62_15430 [Escherichia coli]